MILLTLSRGKGEETVRLQLPASPAEIGETFAFLDRISLDTTATAILDVSSNVPVLYRCLYDVDVEDSEQFQKLQKLAERTEALSPAKAAIFSGALDAECVWNLEGALTVADRLDEYRGNSQDNAPMESFFGRLKCELLDLVALCPDASTVSRMISGYIDAYNHRHYQYALAGLTPSEYYTYVTTGIYPVDNYYGIKATELMPIQALIAARRRAAEEKAKKYREASAKKRAMAQGKKKDPEFVIARDQRILRREIAKWTRSKELALQQISHLREILELSQKARAYLMTASADLILQLYNGENWGAHPELAYIYKMRELF